MVPRILETVTVCRGNLWAKCLHRVLESSHSEGFLLSLLGDAQKHSNVGVRFYHRESLQQVFQNFPQEDAA